MTPAAAGHDVRGALGTIWKLWYQASTADRSQWTQPLGRLLVLLTTVLLLAMPVTEHLCNWDHFLRGGADVEFNLLAWLLFAAMVVLSMHGTMLQPAMMQPGMMQPAFLATIAPRDLAAAPGALARGGAGQFCASISSRYPSSRNQGLDELAPVSPCGMNCRTVIPLRI
jgi:hypothetical protein